MAVDKLVDSAQLDADLEDVADAIRTKGGTSAALAFPAGFVSAVEAIQTGITPTGTINITQNGTYDVTALAEAVVNVAGGGGSGLEYETGTWTPTSDIAMGEVYFSNAHGTSPVFVFLSDASPYSSITGNSNLLFVFVDPYKLFGSGYPYSSSAERYAALLFLYRSSSSVSSNSLQLSKNSSTEITTDPAYPGYWANSTFFRPYSNSSSRYWRSGRTYKWIAVWGP